MIPWPASPRLDRTLRLSVAAVALGLLGVGAHSARMRLVRALFVDGPEQGAPPALPPARPADRLAPSPLGLDPVRRVRVVLIDGLRADVAHGLPHLDALCAGGLDLTMDAGFPTVSLPIERALWTGETQRQSGIEFRAQQLVEPPSDALPLKVDGRAVAESHGFIVRSLGFKEVAPLPTGPHAEYMGWSEAVFLADALATMKGDERLGYVHILRVDDAGHQSGPRSPEYVAAARSADDTLGALLAAERDAHAPAQAGGVGAGTRWFVLSDHGHLPRGGHGDAEPEIRITRLCITGTIPSVVAARARPGTTIHAVDVARAIGDSMGVPLGWDARGRPLGVALADPAPDATLPRPSVLRATGAAALLLVAAMVAGLAVAQLRRPRIARALLLAGPIAYATVVVLRGAPSLSRVMVYRTWPWVLALHFAPGLLLLLGAALLALARRADAEEPAGPLSVAAAALALPLGFALASLLLCGGEVLVGLSATPPLAPFWTGRALAGLALVATAALALALAALAGVARAAIDRRAPSETPRTGA